GPGRFKIRHLIRDGKLRRQLTDGTLGTFKGSTVDFVILKNGQVVLGRGHSVISGGDEVVFAGSIKFDNQGHVREVTNASGHYRPPSGEGLTEAAIDYLRSLGINIEKALPVEIDTIP
ncbi:MAG TPA: hypothetical protein VEB66_11265, partial [Opitutaceae bacterium]|nr:hypothetical protein [Opitutaceae bacterium]